MNFIWAASSQKSAFEQTLNMRIHIILHMRKVSSGYLLSIEILSIPMILFVDSEGPDQTAHPRSLILAFAVRIWPESTFPHAGDHLL